MVKRILIADDSLLILEMLKVVLSEGEFEVSTLSCGTQLITTAEQFRPHLIILDMRLPGYHDGELCRAIKRHPKLRQIPVLMLSAYTATDDDLSFYGCDASLLKPFDLSDLLDKVSMLLKLNPS